MAIESHKVNRRGSGIDVADRRLRLATTSFLERLPLLLDELRRLGFPVGLDQHFAVNELLIGFAAREAFPLQDAAVFGRLLCPLFAKSPLQQEIFAEAFENWLRRLPRGEANTNESFCLCRSLVEKTESEPQDHDHGGL